MIIALRLLFSIVLVSMLAVTSWASSRCPLFLIPRNVLTHPWFLATLADAYWGFITFYVWVCYQRTSWLARIIWFAAIMLLGNIAMAAYWLDALLRTPADGKISDIFVSRRDEIGWLGPLLAIVGVTVLVFA